MVKHPRYTQGCHCCEVKMTADRSRDSVTKGMVSRVETKFRQMKKVNRKTMNKKLIDIADQYLDEIRQTPELIDRYKDAVGFASDDVTPPVAGNTWPSSDSMESLAVHYSFYKTFVNNALLYVAKKVMAKIQ